ncbi:VOC family protein [Spirilliplanes yamanashiensis]|uniref:Glyoxalase n=1 Tax=Spirilliplanes yamanashiensis TaxID=42233 RepID=A0A8J3YB83_9ACTN|nr:VOC family protein [Spirilliplanes yamanashiensis]MDP9817894.1 catechol 2,3-dioxygenase-like lactoylglutathione lyase family enzyme [Spirilliplanes yamanashiensis]GIJ04704.1 glyoxalase [Spirilliplanes yamanashiensis]
MTVRLGHITINARDPYRLAQFWQQMTGYGPHPDGPNEPGEDEAYLAGPPGAPALLFVRVPDAKTARNRVHLDVVPTGRTRDEEVAWLLGLGATEVDDRRRGDGTGWVVLADPEGNEFCVERSDAERGR